MLVITCVCIFNVYYNGFLLKWFMKQKRFFQIAGIVVTAVSVYLLIKKNPAQTKNILLHANNCIKYMPINKSVIDQFSPIFDFTNENQHYENLPIGEITPSMATVNNTEKKIKRCVSETKKKYVASMQDWKCASCDAKLNAWYEIDHKKRLEYGGTNNVDNLVALCRECHGRKTAMENM